MTFYLCHRNGNFCYILYFVTFGWRKCDRCLMWVIKYILWRKCIFCHKFYNDSYCVTNLWHSLFVTTKPKKHHKIYAMADNASAMSDRKSHKNCLLPTWRWLGYDVADPLWRFDSSQNNEWPNKTHLDSTIFWAKLQAHYIYTCRSFLYQSSPFAHIYYRPFLIQPITNIAARSPMNRKIHKRST